MNSISIMAASNLHISIAADTLFHVGPLSVTNSMLLGALGVIIVVAILTYVAFMLKNNRYNRFVGLVQWAFEGLYHGCEDIVGDKKMARSIAPLAITIFFTVLVTYWLAILPGVGSVTVGKEHLPLLRGLPADLNFTFALALITIVAVQIYAIKRHGFFGNIGRYIVNPIKNPIGAFEGLLELIGEMSRMVALSLRLFGNAFAGEVLLMVVAILTSYFATVTLPLFMVFELFIGFIQAYVFYVLTLIFAALATASHGHESSHAANDSAHSPVPSKAAAE